jgi:diguanylate cyclase (GGDEF)-like protein/PAS domain S-box-containing protein
MNREQSNKKRFTIVEKPCKQTRHSTRNRWFYTITTGVVVFLLTLFCLKVTQYPSCLATVWFPTAFLIPVFFRAHFKDWPLLLIPSAVGIIAANIIISQNVLGIIPATLDTLLDVMLCTALLRRALPHHDPLLGLHNWVKFLLIAVVACPLINAMLVTVFHLIDCPKQAPINQFAVWYMADAVAILTLSPLGLVYRHGYFRRSHQTHRLWESLLTLILTLAATLLALMYLPYSFAFITIPLLWCAIRLPRVEALLVLLCVSMMLALLYSLGSPSMTHQIHTPGGLALLPILLVMLPANVMVITMHSLRMEKANIVESENRFRNAMEYSAIGMALLSPQGKFIQVNKALCQLLGYPAAHLTTLSFYDITHPEDMHNDLQKVQQLLAGEIDNYTMEKRYLCRNGNMVWTLMARSVVRDDKGKPLYFIAQIEDISDLKHTEQANKRLAEALHEEKELLHITLNAINEAVISTDRKMTITFMNPVAEHMTGWTEREAYGHPVSEVVHISQGVDGPKLDPSLEGVQDNNLHSAIEQSLVLHGRQRGVFDVQLAISPLKTLNDTPIGMVLVLQDVSKSRELMRQLTYSASHDLLTGLVNRGSFEKSLNNALNITQTQAQHHCLAFLDLDHFKAVNDSAGHAAGDELLRQISQLMREHIRSSDQVARLGGDEFAILLFHCPLETGTEILQQLVDKINEFRLLWNNDSYFIGVSAGITAISDGNISGSEYMARADIACYTAKNNGRGQLAIYEQLNEQHGTEYLSNNLLNVHEINSVLFNNQLNILCQAVVADNRQSVQFYLLSVHPDIPTVPQLTSSEFLAAAQCHNMQSEIDNWLFRRVLLDFGQQIMHNQLRIALPLSGKALLQQSVQRQLKDTLAKTPLPMTAIYLLIDHGLLTTHRTISTFICNLKNQGCHIVLQNVTHQAGDLNKIEPSCGDVVEIDALQLGLLDEMVVSTMTNALHNRATQILAGPMDTSSTFEKLQKMGVDLFFGDAVAPAIPLAELCERP